MNFKVTILLLALANIASASPWTLASGSSVGATTLTLDGTAVPMNVGSVVIVDPFTVNAEGRKITAVSTNTLTLGRALKKAHGLGTQVSFVATDALSFGVYGVVGNNSAADAVAIQAALDDQHAAGTGIYLEGQAKLCRIATPIILPASTRIRNITFNADSGFAPVDATNAMLMASQGYVGEFTAGTDDVITTPTTHLLPGTGVLVMFKNVTGMAGITPGRIYYARDIDALGTGTTFKVAATAGGAAVDITSSGSGTSYHEINSMSRIYLRDVTVDGSLVTNLNGMNVLLQQPADIWKLRINNCDGVGLRLSGQDGTFYNLMIIGCRKGLVLDADCKFFKFYSWNIENCDVGVETILTSGSNFFYGGHVEMGSSGSYATPTSAVFTGTSALMVDSMTVTMTDDTQTVFQHTGANTNGYLLRNIVSTSASADFTMIDDASRGITKKMWTDFRGRVFEYGAPAAPTSDTFPDEPRYSFVGKNGRHVKFGSTDKDLPVLELQADTDQVGAILNVKNTAGAVAAAISPTGAVSSLYQRYGSGSPEGVVAAPVGAVYHRTDGGTGTSIYVKETGTTTSSGWVAK